MYGLLTSSFFSISATRRIWTFLKRARCRAAMSWYIDSTASARESARNSLTIWRQSQLEVHCFLGRPWIPNDRRMPPDR